MEVYTVPMVANYRRASQKKAHLYNTVHRPSNQQLDTCCTERDEIENNISLGDINVIMQRQEREK